MKTQTHSDLRTINIYQCGKVMAEWTPERGFVFTNTQTGETLIEGSVAIYPDGRVQEIAPRNGRDFRIKEFYKLLDCELIQVLDYNDEHYERMGERRPILIVDEEGKLTGQPVNRFATMIGLQFRQIAAWDNLRGAVAVIRSELFR